jgi:hypothetical protein
MQNGNLPFHVIPLSFFIFLSGSAYPSEVAILNGKQFVRTTTVSPNFHVNFTLS